MQQKFPILEFDPTPEAIIEPRRVIKPLADIPEHAVLCFFQEVIAKLVSDHKAEKVYRFKSEFGEHPVYVMNVLGRRVVVFHPGVGAPLAAGILDECIALGCTKFVACGGAGVLRSEIAVGHVIVPSSAIRDEGTSYHYLPPSREVSASPAGVAAIEKVLTARNVEYIVSKTWTTDALYRETPQKVQQRKGEGCAVVEMEAAAFFAVAQFRGVQFAQLLYGGDDVGSEKWDSRGWNSHSVRESLFWLAAESCLEM